MHKGGNYMIVGTYIGKDNNTVVFVKTQKEELAIKESNGSWTNLIGKINCAKEASKRVKEENDNLHIILEKYTNKTTGLTQ